MLSLRRMVADAAAGHSKHGELRAAARAREKAKLKEEKEKEKEKHATLKESKSTSPITTQDTSI